MTHTVFFGWRSRVCWLLVGMLALILVGGTAPEALSARAARSLAAPSAALIVNSNADTQANDGVCTLREAILNANADNQSGSTDCAAGSGADTITFNLAYPNTITLTSQLPTITSTLTLQGPGADRLALSGNTTVGILGVDVGAVLNLSRLTLTKGHAGNGAAIFNQGTLSVADSIFTSNASTSSSGAILNYAGTLTVTASSFSGNSAVTAGGAVSNFGGTLQVVNSTFNGNSVSGLWGGGAIYSQLTVLRARGVSPESDILGDNFSSVTDPSSPIGPASLIGPASPNAGGLMVINSSFWNNTAAAGGGGIGNGGNTGTGGTTMLQNNLLANNKVGAVSVNCFNNAGTLTDGGYNIEDVNTCGFSGTSLKNTDPVFLGIWNSGGPTPTLIVRHDSPAVDYIPAGANGCGTTLTTDQRGVLRPLDGNGDGTAACDVGAYESDQQLGPTFVVNQNTDDAGVCSPGLCSLRQAISTAQTYPVSAPYTITFNLSSYPNTITLGGQLPTITGTLTLQGPGADRLAISGHSAVGILTVNDGANLAVSGLAFASGHAGNGGAISSYGSLSVTNCAFISNVSTFSSGAIYNDGGTAVVTGSTFQDNTAGSAGGAIGNYGGTLTVVNSTFSGNSAAGSWGGGAIYNRVAVLRASGTSPDRDSRGAAAASAAGPTGAGPGTLSVIASSFSGNTAAGGGGAIGNGGSGEAGGSVTLQNNLMGGNQVGGVSVNCFNNAGTLTDGGYNIEDTNTCGFSGPSLKNTDPLFVGLSNHGGGTLTIAVQRYSPAIDRIPNGVSGCGGTQVTDQRGVHRPLDGNADGAAACDVGAYESDQQLGPTFVVNQIADDAGVCGQLYCTLRQAILSAQMAPSGVPYTITFNLTYPANAILLDSQLPAITGQLTIQGPGADKVAVSGRSTVRILAVNAGVTLTVQGLAFFNGRAGNGGAISSDGSLNVRDCAFISNTATASSGAIYNHGGTAMVIGSTFSGNSAATGGGAIFNDGGALTVVNSSFANNSAGGAWGGGAILSTVAVLRTAGASPVGDSLGAAVSAAAGPASPGTPNLMVINNSFSGNTAPGGGGSIGNGGNGVAGGTATLQNNLFAGSLVGGVSVNCHTETGTLTDGGYNLEDANTCGLSGTSLTNTVPLFVGLGYYGGSTTVLAVRGDSPAIDRIPSGVNGCGTTLTTDQRGVHRPLDGNADGTAACDIGAYESDQQPGPAFIVNQVVDDSGLCTTSACSLRQAIFTAQTYPSATLHTIFFSLTYPDTITLNTPLPTITSTLTIQGPGADKVAVSGGHATRLMVVNSGATLTLKGLTLTNGNASNGGALINQGTLNVTDCAFTGNTSSASSGAIYNHGGIAVVTGSTFSGNSAYNAGGAIGNYGSSLTVVNSTFFKNSVASSWGGGALYSRAAALRASTGATPAGDSLGAAGVFADGPDSPSAASLQVAASTFLSNTAPGGGGAIGNGGNGEVGGTAALQNNLFAGSLVGGVSVNCHNESGTLTDGGYNIEDTDTCGFSGTSLKNTNPVLADLANNGGPTWTIAMPVGSPAIDRIPSGSNGCGTTLVTDQRGIHRPLDGNLDGIAACDAGAYEFNYHILYLPLIVRTH